MSFKVKDHYFKKAKQENYLARSVYKLEEIDQKFKLLRPGNLVLDLGYYPGSWVQYASGIVGPQGMVVGVDIQGINPKLTGLKNVKLISGDIAQLVSAQEFIGDKLFDVVLSDMAPSTTGVRSVDQQRSLELVEMIFSKLTVFLRPNGNFVAKIFESHFAQEFLKANKSRFSDYRFFRPKSIRSESKEYFVIGKGFKA